MMMLRRIVKIFFMQTLICLYKINKFSLTRQLFLHPFGPPKIAVMSDAKHVFFVLFAIIIIKFISHHNFSWFSELLFYDKFNKVYRDSEPQCVVGKQMGQFAM